MGVSPAAPVATKANGLNTAINVIAAPSEAFATLRVAPTWGWAFLIAVVLTAVGQYLGIHAAVHAMQTSWPAQVAANPALAGASAQSQQNALNVSLSVLRWVWVFSPILVLVGAFVGALVMFVVKAAARGDATFKQLWCAAMNVAVVSAGISALLTGVIAVVRGPDTFNSPADTYEAIPSLAWIVPHASIKSGAFLAGFNVVSVWAAVLIALAMTHLARTSKAAGALCGIVLLCIAAGFMAWGAR